MQCRRIGMIGDTCGDHKKKMTETVKTDNMYKLRSLRDEGIMEVKEGTEQKKTQRIAKQSTVYSSCLLVVLQCIL